MASTLLDRYGRPTVALIITTFYGHVLRSARLGHYFDNIHLGALVDHQAKFMAMAMGDTPTYTSDDLRRAHQHLGIDRDDFDEMLRLLESTLLEFGVTPADADSILESYRAREPQVVGGPSSQ